MAPAIVTAAAACTARLGAEQILQGRHEGIPRRHRHGNRRIGLAVPVHRPHAGLRHPTASISFCHLDLRLKLTAVLPSFPFKQKEGMKKGRGKKKRVAGPQFQHQLRADSSSPTRCDQRRKERPPLDTNEAVNSSRQRLLSHGLNANSVDLTNTSQRSRLIADS